MAKLKEKQKKKVAKKDIKKSNKKNVKANKIKQHITQVVTLSVIIFAVIFCAYKIIKLAIKPTDSFLIEQGKVEQAESVIGYVIRDEKVIQMPDESKKMIQIKNEGERVSVGEEVFRYEATNEEELNSKIKDLNNQIQTAMEGQVELPSSDIKALEKQIESKINGIKDKNNLQDIKEYKSDINGYITKKAKIAGELSPSGAYINNLINISTVWRITETTEKFMLFLPTYPFQRSRGSLPYRLLPKAMTEYLSSYTQRKRSADVIGRPRSPVSIIFLSQASRLMHDILPGLSSLSNQEDLFSVQPSSEDLFWSDDPLDSASDVRSVL